MNIRETLFRGKRIDNGEWVKGFPIMYRAEQTGIAQILPQTRIKPVVESECWAIENLFCPKIDNATFSQFTGLLDIHCVLIFDGDIVKYAGNIYKIVFEVGGFALCDVRGEMISKIGGVNDYLYPLMTLFDECCWDGDWARDLEIIGNVWDNPELLQEGKADGQA